MNVIMIIFVLGVLYFAGAFVSAKFFNRDQWPFTAKGLALKDHQTVLPPPIHLDGHDLPHDGHGPNQN